MTDIMKLADEYAACSAKHALESLYGTSKSYTKMCKVEEGEARAALQSAIEALQAENADLAFLADQWKAERNALKAQTQDFIEQLIETSQNLGLYDK